LENALLFVKKLGCGDNLKIDYLENIVLSQRIINLVSKMQTF